MLNTERTLDCILEDETAISVNREELYLAEFQGL